MEVLVFHQDIYVIKLNLTYIVSTGQRLLRGIPVAVHV